MIGFEQRIDRYNNDDAFIANIFNSEIVKKHYCNIVYDAKAIDINWYIENKRMFIHNATLEQIYNKIYSSIKIYNNYEKC